MPYGGNDWLALTQEATLEPEIAICDPHHHFWDFRNERIPYQRYLLHELAADVHCGHDVRSTVFIEARSMYRPDGPAELRPVGEVEFVQGLAAASATGLYGPCKAAASIIGHADLKLADRVRPVLEALQAASPNRFRGIRHTVTWDAHPEVGNRERQGVLASAEYRAGAKVLAGMGLSLDTGVCFPQLPELADFARAVPDLTITLNHIGGLLCTGYADTTTVFSTSGTTGDATLYAHAWDRWHPFWAATARDLWEIGVRPGDYVLGSGFKMRGPLYHADQMVGAIPVMVNTLSLIHI